MMNTTNKMIAAKAIFKDTQNIAATSIGVPSTVTSQNNASFNNGKNIFHSKFSVAYTLFDS